MVGRSDVVDGVTYRVAGSHGYPIGRELRITAAALVTMLTTLGRNPAESGGKLYAPTDLAAVTVYEHDMLAGAGQPTYRPDIGWASERLKFWQSAPVPHVWLGDAHSHPTHWCGFLSRQDVDYISEIFSANELLAKIGTFLAPTVTFDPDGVPVVWPWAVQADRTVWYSPLAVVNK